MRLHWVPTRPLNHESHDSFEREKARQGPAARQPRISGKRGIMITRKAAILICMLAAAGLAIGRFLPSRPERLSGDLAVYAGAGRGLAYAGVAPGDGRDGYVLFRSFNGDAQEIEFRPRQILRQRSDGGEWVQHFFTNAVPYRVPARHVLTFKFPCPEGTEPWRVIFEESRIPPAAEGFAARLEQVLFERRPTRNFSSVSATPVMEGLEPKTEPTKPIGPEGRHER